MIQKYIIAPSRFKTYFFKTICVHFALNIPLFLNYSTYMILQKKKKTRKFIHKLSCVCCVWSADVPFSCFSTVKNVERKYGKFKNVSYNFLYFNSMEICLKREWCFIHTHVRIPFTRITDIDLTFFCIYILILWWWQRSNGF